MGFAAVLFVCLAALAVSIWSLAATADLPPCDHVASLVTTSPLLGSQRQSLALLCFRIAAALLCLVTAVVLLFDPDPFVFAYMGKTVRLLGVQRAATFTVQTFSLMTVYFVGASLLSLNDFFSLVPDASLQWLGLLLNVAFRIIYPVGFLVTIIVTFVLYPAAVHHKLEAQIVRFFHWPVLVMHCANSLMVQVELLLGTPLVDDSHMTAWFCVPVLWGLWYALFAWIYFVRNGVFFYFFLDWRNGWISPLAYVMLLGLLAVMNAFELATRYLIAREWVVLCALTVPATLWLGRYRDSWKRSAADKSKA